MRTAEIGEVLRRATGGDLCWWKPGEGGDVRDIQRAPYLLELRWELEPFDGEIPPVLTRLYFAEPEDYVELLLGLRFGTKDVRDPDSHDRQNDDIDVAERRRVEGRRWHWGLA
ncbi:hypothetical protein CLV30_13145 [Haloactinopolyspora alba]|uniref:Uncharacterized protein n=1 Tax=Haloactinopolyspora alba TaxID=648780 RepID=A0A2P8D731_9ACTN|nr:hypothetical protein [Haloactinopolyspora alba]PSK93018.1 hypothetical protein CLV30_13145 [Haloactinopolyspora alba]